MAEKLWLACTECKSYNYLREKNRTTQREKLRLRKYCPKCRKHVEHSEQRLRD